MKKRMMIVIAGVLTSLLTVTAFAAGFTPNLTVDSSVNGVITVAVASDNETNSVLAEKKPTLTIDCGDWESAKLLAGGGDTALTVVSGKVSFTVAHGGTYLITDQDYSVATTAPSCTGDGKYTYTIGGSTYEETIPATGHDFSSNAAYCRNGCGAKNAGYIAPVAPSVSPTPAPAEPEQPQNPFTDVSGDDYFFDAVLWAVENGITSGTGAATFEPNKVCTRAEMVMFLWRAAGKPEPVSKENPFTDVTGSDDFYKAVLWAMERGITRGTDVTTFGPSDTCTRAQAAAFLYRCAGSPKTGSANPFADAQETDYFYHAVIWAADEEITKGTSTTTFSPDDSCTRAQIVTFLYRYQQG